MKNSNPVRYRIFPKNPEAHLFEVTCTVDDPDPQGQRFALPAWIPGSYMIREFARHVVAITAKAGRRPLAVRQTGQAHLDRRAGAGPITVTIEVYAWDLSVRGAHLDTGPWLLQWAVRIPPGARPRNIGRAKWISCVPPAHATGNGKSPRPCGVRTAPAYGFGTYKAADYDELIDHPVEMGTFTLGNVQGMRRAPRQSRSRVGRMQTWIGCAGI